jgi:hypothetical protein
MLPDKRISEVVLVNWIFVFSPNVHLHGTI